MQAGVVRLPGSGMAFVENGGIPTKILCIPRYFQISIQCYDASKCKNSKLKNYNLIVMHYACTGVRSFQLYAL